MTNSQLLYPQAQPDDDGPILGYVKDLFAKTTESFDKALKTNRYHMRQAMAKAQPVYAPQYGNVTLDSSGNGLIDFGGPMLGRRWVLRMITFSDASSFWASAGNAQAAICVGQALPGGTITPNMVRWPVSSIPNSVTFSADQMWVVPRDHILLSITGGTSGQNIQGVLWIQDFSENTALPAEEV